MIKNTRVGIIRCQQTEDICPGDTDFRASKIGKLGFEETGPVDIIGFTSCGGCPGKKAIARAKMMVERGAKIIFFASCISKGSPIGFACPHFDQMKDSIRKTLGDDIQIKDYTH